jgi:hypothetical protein
MSPEGLFRFVEIEPFPRLWSNLNLEDEDLQSLQIHIMAAPTSHPVIPGSKGLRKLRFSRPRSRTGRSGSFRVYYAFFEEYGIVLLMAIIAENERSDLTKADVNALGSVIERAGKLLE